MYIVTSELNDPIWHSLEWQIGSFSFEATIYAMYSILYIVFFCVLALQNDILQ